MEGSKKPDPRRVEEMGAMGQHLKESSGREVTSYPQSECQWKKSHQTVRRWASEKHKSWGIPVEGFRNHVATDGFLLGVSGKWRAFGWSVVQLDHDEEMEPMYGIYGTLNA